MTAFSAALGGALMLYWCERRWPEVQEAIIGRAFMLAASAGILFLAGNPHAAEHLKDLMIGQILWVIYQQLPVVAGLYIGQTTVMEGDKESYYGYRFPPTMISHAVWLNVKLPYRSGRQMRRFQSAGQTQRYI